MVKRHNYESHEFEPVRKKAALCEDVGSGDVMVDLSGKQWKLGESIGQGAFGKIYVASDIITDDVHITSPYVAKIELHTNGPLFVEINFYLRVAKQILMNEWEMKKHKTLGIPRYIASGSYMKNHTKYRFLILPRYTIDLEKINEKYNSKFNIKTVITIGLQLLDALEYIHSNGFIHADIKASNIMLQQPHDKPSQEKIFDTPKRYSGYSKMKYLRTAKLFKKRKIGHNLRPNKNFSFSPWKCDCHKHVQETKRFPERFPDVKINTNQVYLLDFGLACKYRLTNGEHKPYSIDARKAHGGTLAFCSVDAHSGIYSRRSDLENLGYNMIYWLTRSLPWMQYLEDCDKIMKKKQMCMRELDKFFYLCFGPNVPAFLKNYFIYVKTLHYEETPNYDYCRKLLKQGFKEYGYKRKLALDFESAEGWGDKKHLTNNENASARVTVISTMMRTPLKSNIPKHARRKNKAENRRLRWSKILLDDPEALVKSGKKMRERENDCDANDTLDNLNIYDLNPTSVMVDVYNNYLGNPPTHESFAKYNGDDSPCIHGYNATMMSVYKRMMINRELENQKLKLAEPVTKRPRGRPRKAKCLADIRSIFKNSPPKSPKAYNTRSKVRSQK